MLNYLIMGLKAGLSAIILVTDVVNGKTTSGAADCYANYRLGTDGRIYENSVAASDNFSTDVGSWLSSGNSSNVWVERDNLAGSPGTLNGYDPGAGRLQLNVDRDFGVVEVTTTQTHTCTFDLTFYDAATGGAVLYGPVNVNLNATEQI